MLDLKALYQKFKSGSGVCTDTRLITQGCLFFALKGDNFDGHRFVQEALNKGAAYAVVDSPLAFEDERCIYCPDVLRALQDLARYHRQQLHIPIIGLTGSNGKTTSKELINAVLKEKYNTFATHGNLNNHIGVPLSLLAIKAEVEIAIIEMGANHQKEIELLCSIAQPTHGLITNVGIAHIEGFGSIEGVRKGKAELYDWLFQNQGVTFINADNDLLINMAQERHLKDLQFYGSNTTLQVHGALKSFNPYLSVSWTDAKAKYEVKTQLTGKYNFENIMAAISIGKYFKLTAEEINTGLSDYTPSNNRSQISETENNRVICDFYNANPSSMQAALDNLEQLEAQDKVAILGDMFELGTASEAQHRAIVTHAQNKGFMELVFIGSHFYEVQQQTEGLRFFEHVDEAQVYLTERRFKHCTILLKGSRGMQLERLMSHL